MSTPTLLELRTRARIRADQDKSAFPSDVQYNYFINEGARETWFDLIQAGWPVDFTSTSITAAGTSVYQLNGGSPVLSVRAVWFLLGGNFYELRRLNLGKEAQMRSAIGQGNYAAFYEIRQSPTLGTVIELFPSQNSGTYRVDHIPEFPGLVNDTDMWYGPARSDELIVLRSAMKGARKEQNMAVELKSEYDELFQKVINMASWLDQRNAAQIRDMASTSPRQVFDYPVAGPGWSGEL
jgi:hypothetical protein